LANIDIKAVSQAPSFSTLLSAVHSSTKAIQQTLLALAFGVGGFLRVWQINRVGFNSDEAVYAGQAVAIAGITDLQGLFPVFRAHPLLFQFLLSLLYRLDFSDVGGRLLSVLISLGTIYLTYQLGKLLYGGLTGATAALFMALMPYHIVISRQVLLDGPMVFFTTLTLYLLAKYAKTEAPGWLYATGAALGLSFLAKETAIILLGAVYAFLALAGSLRVRIFDLVISIVVMALVIAPFPLSLLLAGGSTTGKQYLIWQLFRRPNHSWDFYPTVTLPAIGWSLILAALLGLVLLKNERPWVTKLLLAWILVPTAFFQIWPTKGFQYLLPIAPAIAILAAWFAISWRPPLVRGVDIRVLAGKGANALLVAVIAFPLLYSSVIAVQPPTSLRFLAGSGGVPGGREAGLWVRYNIPKGAKLMTIGPSMANILQFYGHRKAYGLSVSSNPLLRNPSYQPIHNVDFQLRSSEINYIVWDSFSANRSPFFSNKVLEYARRYNGRVVYTGSISMLGEDGNDVIQPVIVIFEVRP
jgi:hypothetical protein